MAKVKLLSFSVDAQAAPAIDATLCVRFDDLDSALTWIVEHCGKEVNLKLGEGPMIPVQGAADHADAKHEAKDTPEPEPKKPRAAKAKAEPAPEPEAKTEVLETTAVLEKVDGPPAVLVTATSFKTVMMWMLGEGGFTKVEDIVRRCELWRDNVPAIQRLGGDLNERVARAFEVLTAK